MIMAGSDTTYADDRRLQGELFQLANHGMSPMNAIKNSDGRGC